MVLNHELNFTWCKMIYNNRMLANYPPLDLDNPAYFYARALIVRMAA